MDNNESISVSDEKATAGEAPAVADIKASTAVTDKKKKKGKRAAVIIIAVLIPLISALAILSVIGIIAVSELRSPEKAIMNMLEEGKYDEALARYYHEFSEDGASEKLINMLCDRVDTLIDEICTAFEASTEVKTTKEAVKPIFGEIKTIMSLQIPEVNKHARTKVFNELGLALIKLLAPDSFSDLLDIPSIF